MATMVVTLEVSKLSGWLKADAYCRVEGRACDAGGEVLGAGRRERACGVVAAHKTHARGKGPTQGLGAKGTRGAHAEHGEHGRGAGGVEAQRLVERRRGLPSRREGRRCGGGEVRAGRREGLWCGGGTQAACTGKRPVSRFGGQGHARSARGTCHLCQ